MRKFTDKINESVEDKIPTAEQLLLEIMGCLKLDHGLGELNENDPELVPYLLEEINKRTKLHVEAALKAASKKADMLDDKECWRNCSCQHPCKVIDKDSILNAYPLDNIK